MTELRLDPAPLDPVVDVPRRPSTSRSAADRLFRAIATGAACFAFVIVVGAIVALFMKARPALRANGVWHFLTRSVWNNGGEFGILGLLLGTVIVAAIAMSVALPFGVGMALFINEYAPRKMSRVLTTVIDLLAALPSILYGMWGRDAFAPKLEPVAHWMSVHLVAVPFFQLSESDAQLSQSSFIAGVVVGIMVIPIVCSVTRDVMAQVPREQCEGALALGGTRWGMIRAVIFPFARSGIAGATLLGFGRALGETIAVQLILSPRINVNWHVLEQGGSSVAGHIVSRFPEAQESEISGLVGAGLALLLLTIAVNLVARAIVNRNRLA